MRTEKGQFCIDGMNSCNHLVGKAFIEFKDRDQHDIRLSPDIIACVLRIFSVELRRRKKIKPTITAIQHELKLMDRAVKAMETYKRQEYCNKCPHRKEYEVAIEKLTKRRR